MPRHLPQTYYNATAIWTVSTTESQEDIGSFTIMTATQTSQNVKRLAGVAQVTKDLRFDIMKTNGVDPYTTLLVLVCGFRGHFGYAICFPNIIVSLKQLCHSYNVVQQIIIRIILYENKVKKKL